MSTSKQHRDRDPAVLRTEVRQLKQRIVELEEIIESKGEQVVNLTRAIDQRDERIKSLHVMVDQLSGDLRIARSRRGDG